MSLAPSFPSRQSPADLSSRRLARQRNASGEAALSVVCSLLPQRLQRTAPRDDLVEHGVDRLLVLRSRLKDAEILEAVNMESKTWLRTVAICTSASTRRSCSTARAPPALP